MELKPWPADFGLRKAGVGCAQCEQGRVDETEHGVRYFVGEVADGYLQKSGPTAGYSVVIFRGRHVGAPQEMTSDEHAAFWSEVGRVANAIEQVYRPVHLNFQILGNQDPHVHVHIVPRHDPDPAPSMPLPAEAWAMSHRLDTAEVTRQLVELRVALSSRGPD
jgi:diadenosine tetraphosphate (Ap4A) HIT family hydrolase